MGNYKHFPLHRRQILLAAGATLMQTAMPEALQAAGKGMVTRALLKKPGFIIPDLKNPYFHPVGAPSGTAKPPKPRKGKKVSALESATRFADGGGAAAAGLMTAAVTAALGRTSSALGIIAGAAAATDTIAQTAPSTLILYDTTNTWGWLGELYAIMAANLASHFGTWTAMPVVSYTSGTLQQYSAAIYIGSTYGEPLPIAFLADVSAGTTPVIWAYDNIWQLPGIVSQFGLNWKGFDFSSVAEVDYKSQKLKRYAANGGGIMDYWSVSSATVLATCVRADGSTFPWAVRSGNLTYIGENPLAYITEGDRYLIFCDLIFDALAPSTPERHRAIVRLEDINPTNDPTELRNIANWLSANNIPFAFETIPQYSDPLGYYNGSVPVSTPLHNVPTVINALKFMQSKGGVQVLHGYTHQYSNVINPSTGVRADDAEFYRITQNADLTWTYVGALAEDSAAWVTGRFTSAFAELAASGFAAPTIHTCPHYAGSANESNVASATFAARYDRVLYFSGLLNWLSSGGTTPLDYTRVAGQYFPYTVNDVYGGKVLPECLGNIEPTPFGPFPARLPADIIADAQRTLVVRDGVASFFFHPFYSLSYLQQTVQGIQALGYTFVNPASL
jgi:uncharacterized protein YdaL